MLVFRLRCLLKERRALREPVPEATFGAEGSRVRVPGFSVGILKWKTGFPASQSAAVMAPWHQGLFSVLEGAAGL